MAFGELFVAELGFAETGEEIVMGCIGSHKEMLRSRV